MVVRKRKAAKKKSRHNWQHYFRRAVILGAVSIVLSSIHHLWGPHAAIFGGGLFSALMSDIEDGLLG